ncbi:MAG: 30S ribosomal protein S12 methylthiotransferase RimO [Succinivibrionaceae bacterium]|nr:30S ribosomal protein S12 methylthiotransferase RimO [Succinivibrionaceae bacterium]
MPRGAAQGRAPTVGIVSLGCAKNLVDSERLTSALVAMGYRISGSYEGCDLVVVNTCGFINPAVDESLDAIGEALESGCKVLVMGCLGARADLIRRRHPGISAVYGPGRRAAVLRGIAREIGIPPAPMREAVGPAGLTLTPSHYSYLKISEGCRHRCSFCVIPALRGPLVSRRGDDIMREAEAKVASGVRELLVIAQDSSDYGVDLGPGESLTALLRRLATLGAWLRVHYVYPGREADRLVELMGEGLVLPYLDAPLQHVSSHILRDMRRPGSLERSLESIQRWRQACPGLAIRSTFITGFPGESEEDFGELLDFLREARLDRVGCFPYSNVDGAAANDLPGQVEEDVKSERAAILMEVQGEISDEILEGRMGSRCDLMVDEVTEEGLVIGRTAREAPEVDGVVTVEGLDGARPGEIHKVTLTSHDEHDLWAEPAAQPIPFRRD